MSGNTLIAGHAPVVKSVTAPVTRAMKMTANEAIDSTTIAAIMKISTRSVRWTLVGVLFSVFSATCPG